MNVTASRTMMREGRSLHSRSHPLAEVLIPRESPGSRGSCKHVVIVMDALKEFSMEPLQWALDCVIEAGCSVTLLGVLPWIPFPFSCKIGLDVWRHVLEDMRGLMGRKSGARNDPKKHQKIRGIMDLCKQKQVVPLMKVAMGHPFKLVVLEQTTSLHATFVVLDRHLRRHKAFFEERLPSSAVMMNRHGGVDVIKIKARTDGFDSTVTGESSATIVRTPEVILSEELLERLRRQTSI
ncbi:unnamed protein product [Linum tenue]|uniref:Uncharacterized protein n=1 Tax=Linum tenue TaxID=586396 RepID=A0AAV0IKU2_9ROSI|nr:unnamed protein product [Linum tenue]